MRRALSCVPTPHPPGWCILPLFVREELRHGRSYVRCASLVAQEDNLMAINSFLVYVKMFKYLNNIPKLARETNQRPKPRQRQRRNCRPPSDRPPACTALSQAACKGAARIMLLRVRHC